MNEQELRIGNWYFHNDNFNYRGHKGYFRWTMRDFMAVEECTLFLENVSGIPITPEILEKYGKKHYDCWDFNGIWLQEYDQSQKRIWVNGDYIGIIHLEFLHELQNIVLDLANTELNIEL